MEGTTYPRMNRVFLTGIAQEEPELRYTPSGVSVSSFRVQVGRILRDRSGGAREVAAYLTVVAWQEAAQRMSRELRKGQAVYVEGYVSSRSFTTARGDKRTAIEIYAEQVQILGPFREGEKTEPVAGMVVFFQHGFVPVLEDHGFRCADLELHWRGSGDDDVIEIESVDDVRVRSADIGNHIERFNPFARGKRFLAMGE